MRRLPVARSRTASKAGRRPTSRGELDKLKRIARSASKAHPGPLIYPNLAAGIHERSPLKFAKAYFKKRVRAAFASPLATDFDFLVQAPTRVTYTGRSGPELVATIQDELFHYHQYLSTYLTHPRYGPENECGFSRGDTLEPVGLREVGPGIFEFRVRGIVVGRKDLLRRIAGPWRTKKVQAPRVPAPERAGDAQIFVSMPTRPDAREVSDVEWYEFNPDHWLHAHRSEEHTSELQSHRDLHSFPTRRSSDLGASWSGARTCCDGSLAPGAPRRCRPRACRRPSEPAMRRSSSRCQRGRMRERSATWSGTSSIRTTGFMPIQRSRCERRSRCGCGRGANSTLPRPATTSCTVAARSASR